ncbi:SppA protein [Azospirillum sp. 412522]|nr:hypothetical protein [Azospirillum sp. 412522]MBY6265540.1 SppA protein [Azospirillum sp. 412522]
MTSDAFDILKRHVSEFLNDTGGDTYLFSGSIERQSIDRLRRIIVGKKNKRERANLILTTYGGDPHSAYRLASTLKQHYPNGYRLYAFGHCKSAGTLVAVGASEIIMSEFGELGPLDVQTIKADDLLGRSSGLDIFQAISIITAHAQQAFDQTFLRIIAAGQGSISTKTASEIAIELTVGIFSPISAQIDPVRLGEMQRAVNIAETYGERLVGNLKPGAITRLVGDYPAHGFVINLKEAESLFQRVRAPTDIEVSLAIDGLLSAWIDDPHSEGIQIDVEAFLPTPSENVDDDSRSGNITLDGAPDGEASERRSEDGEPDGSQEHPADRDPPESSEGASGDDGSGEGVA